MRTLTDRFAASLFGAVALLLIVSACAHHGDPFEPVTPGKAESTKVEGNVSGRWVKKSSPYYVIKPIMVPRNKALTIEPGVNVVFTQKGQNLTVLGKLTAIGKPGNDSTITFRPTIMAGAAAHPGDWGGLVFEKSVNNVITNAKIIYATNGVDLQGADIQKSGIRLERIVIMNTQLDAVLATKSDVFLREATISNNGRYGVSLDRCEDPSFDVEIRHCNIGNNAYGGIWSKFSSAFIESTNVQNNGFACNGAPPEVKAFCGGAHFEGTPGVKLPVFHRCNVQNNIPCDIRNLMDDYIVSADSTWWGEATTDIMNQLSNPPDPGQPHRNNCFFNVPAICDAQDISGGNPTVRFCYWRESAWINFASDNTSALPAISWRAPVARWRF